MRLMSTLDIQRSLVIRPTNSPLSSTSTTKEDLVEYLQHPLHRELGRLFWEYLRVDGGRVEVETAIDANLVRCRLSS